MAKKPTKSGGDGKKTENPPPKTTPKVKTDAGTAMKVGSSARERELAASVERHIEPRKVAPKKPTGPKKPLK